MMSATRESCAAQFLLWLAVLALTFGQDLKDRCSFNTDTDHLSCSQRTLNNWNGTLIPASRVKSISIECSDVFFSENLLRTNHFGYLPDLSDLELTSCKIRKVLSLAFPGLPYLQELTIQSHNSELSGMGMEIETESFIGLRNLRVLNLTQNNISTFPPYVFCDLKMLQTLNLSSNFIQDILDLKFSSKSSRDCQLSIQELDLSKNSISSIPAQSLSRITSLRVLNLAGNHISVLHKEAFSKLDRMTFINLSNNKLVTLPSYVFSDTIRLQEIHLQNNSLKALSPGVFLGLDNLLVLNISRNALINDRLNTRTFEKLKTLTVLDLSHNNLTQVRKNLFNGLVSLRILNIMFNQIYSMEAYAISGCPKLHTLDLSHNYIGILPDYAIHSLGQLRFVSLNHNLIGDLQDNFLKNCTILEDLELQHNKLQEIPKAVSHLQLLRILDIGYNQILHVKNESFKGLNYLHALRLSNNKIRQVHQAVFNETPSLQILDLSYNDIERLEQGTFRSLANLKLLRLDNNKLEDINGLLERQNELVRLNLSSNQLDWFDYAFIPRGVRWLDIHNNNLENLGNYYNLSDGFELLTLVASKNKIKKISASSIVKSLEYVLLDENQIDIIEGGTFAEKPNLKRVDLRSNKLQTLSISSISTAGSAEKPDISLGENPLVCDCNIQWLQNINSMSSSQYPRVVDINDLKCNLLNAGFRMDLMSVKQTQFLCQYEANCSALCNCCDFMACDCQMQCPNACSCFHDSTWSMNMINCSRKEHKILPPLIPMDATSIYLDGNNFSRNLGRVFIGQKKVTSLYLNNSKILNITNHTLNDLSELEILDLHGNLIQSLKGLEFSNLTSLKELNLGENLISDIDPKTFMPLENLETLVLSGNRLKKFPFKVLETSLLKLKQIYLSENPWSCDCDFLENLNELKISGKIGDADLIDCFSSKRSCTNALALTQDASDEIVIVALYGFCLFGSIFAAGFICNCFIRMKHWISSICGCQGPHGGQMYDALFIYSRDDQEFVHQDLASRLEKEQMGYRLFLQHRDLPQSSEMSKILPVLGRCSELVLVISESFIQQELSRFLQSKIWRKKTKQTGRDKPIVILLNDDLMHQAAENPDLKLLLEHSKFISWCDLSFWIKLIVCLNQSSSGPTPLNADNS